MIDQETKEYIAWKMMKGLTPDPEKEETEDEDKDAQSVLEYEKPDGKQVPNTRPKAKGLDEIAYNEVDPGAHAGPMRGGVGNSDYKNMGKSSVDTPWGKTEAEVVLRYKDSDLGKALVFGPDGPVLVDVKFGKGLGLGDDDMADDKKKKKEEEETKKSTLWRSPDRAQHLIKSFGETGSSMYTSGGEHTVRVPTGQPSWDMDPSMSLLTGAQQQPVPTAPQADNNSNNGFDYSDNAQSYAHVGGHQGPDTSQNDGSPIIIDNHDKFYTMP